MSSFTLAKGTVTKVDVGYASSSTTRYDAIYQRLMPPPFANAKASRIPLIVTMNDGAEDDVTFSVDKPQIATVDGSRILNHGGTDDGIVTVTATSASDGYARKLSIPMHRIPSNYLDSSITSNKFRDYIVATGVANTVRNKITAEFYRRITPGVKPSIALYSTLTLPTPSGTAIGNPPTTVIRNVNCWLNKLLTASVDSIDVSCIAPLNAFGNETAAKAHLITKRHAVTCAHANIIDGAQFYWATCNWGGSTETIRGPYTVVDHTDIANDIRVHLLDADVHSSIKPPYFLPADIKPFSPTQLFMCPFFSPYSYHDTGGGQTAYSGSNTVIFGVASLAGRRNVNEDGMGHPGLINDLIVADEPPTAYLKKLNPFFITDQQFTQNGDSGSGAYMIWNGLPIFLGTLFSVETAFSSAYKHKADIEAAIAALSTAHSLGSYPLSSIDTSGYRTWP